MPPGVAMYGKQLRKFSETLYAKKSRTLYCALDFYVYTNLLFTTSVALLRMLFIRSFCFILLCFATFVDAFLCDCGNFCPVF